MPLRRTTISLVKLCGQSQLSLLGTLWLTALNTLAKRSWIGCWCGAQWARCVSVRVIMRASNISSAHSCII
ncbi:hypothetical protein PsorP6_019481 [Peronosclerospora sorghi]|nr:hypothetical protein PsorP6_019481 [Peronosclerospora sorghi]